jgi:hypothetical protein
VADPRPLPRADDELAPSSAIAIALASLAVLALLWVVGAGWARWAFDDRIAAAATAPAFGAATLTIAALALERVGVPLDGRWGPALASALAALAGYSLRLVQGKATEDPMP